jgi:hypothetical protein
MSIGITKRIPKTTCSYRTRSPFLTQIYASAGLPKVRKCCKYQPKILEVIHTHLMESIIKFWQWYSERGFPSCLPWTAQPSTILSNLNDREHFPAHFSHLNISFKIPDFSLRLGLKFRFASIGLGSC